MQGRIFDTSIITPNRTTKVYIDAEETSISTLPFKNVKTGQNIWFSGNYNMLYFNEVGVSLKYPSIDKIAHMDSLAHLNVRLSDCVASNLIKEIPMYKRPSDGEDGMHGTLVNASFTAIASGDYFFERRIPQGAEWDGAIDISPITNLFEDLDSAGYNPEDFHNNFVFNGVQINDRSIRMIPILKTEEAHNGSPICFRFGYLEEESSVAIIFSGQEQSRFTKSIDTLLNYGTIVFCGKAIYCAYIDNDLNLYLYEYGTLDWHGVSSDLNKNGWWFHGKKSLGKGQVFGPRVYSLFIRPRKKKVKDEFFNIEFDLQITTALQAGNERINITKHDDVHTEGSVIFKIPFKGINKKYNVAKEQTPLTVFQNPDSRSRFALNYISMPSSGWFTTDIQQPPINRNNIVVNWEAFIPENTSIVCECLAYIASGVQYSLPMIESSKYSATFTRDCDDFYLKFYFYSTNDIYDPIMYSYSVTIPGNITNTTSGTMVPLWELEHVSVTSGGKYALNDTAHVRFKDLNSQFDVLRTRAGIPIKIVIEEPTPVTIFRGYINEANATLQTKANSINIGETWYEYALECVGPWKRIQECTLPVRYYPGEPDTAWLAANLPEDSGEAPRGKVTKLITDFLGYAGFVNEYIEDLDVYVFPGQNEDEKLIEPWSQLDRLITKYLDSYLNYGLAFNGSLGDYGAWELIPPAVAPYVPLAKFNSIPVTENALIHMLDSYPQSPIPQSFMTNFKMRLEQPTANLIIGTSTGTFDQESWQMKSTQMLWNSESVNLNNAQPGDPLYPSFGRDWLGRPIFLGIKALGVTPEVLSWIMYKFMDSYGHTKGFCTFEAPLIFVTGSHGEKRALRWMDPIYIDNEVWIVWSHNIVVDGSGADNRQVCIIEAIKPFNS